MRSTQAYRPSVASKTEDARKSAAPPNLAPAVLTVRMYGSGPRGDLGLLATISPHLQRPQVPLMTAHLFSSAADHAFSLPEQQAVYRAIYERRDMRHFSGGTVADEVLQRLLSAAHHAPSVGFMQPWRFIRVRSRPLRESVHALVEQERVLTAQSLGVREDEFMKLKVQGVLDAAEVLVVALPPGREQHVFGRRTLPEMDLASAACAIQNLWLAARAEGLGVDWVSLFDPATVAT